MKLSKVIGRYFEAWIKRSVKAFAFFVRPRPHSPEKGRSEMSGSAENGYSNLDTMNLFIEGNVRNALQSAVVTWAALERFENHRALFRMNPANALPFTALRALEEMSIVRIAEVLHDKERILSNSAKIVSKQDIIKHRDAISHPFFVKSWWPHMQEFIKEKRQHKDIRPALIWEMQRAINGELREHGFQERNTAVPVTKPMTMMLSLILRLSVKDLSSVPVLSKLNEWLEIFRSEFIAILEKYPDGQVKIEPEDSKNET